MLAALLALAATAAFVGSREHAARPRPNVVVVLIDALRRDHVGTYGHDVETTPFLDELARRGVTFENAWSHAPQTFNSTAALLTSQLFPLLLARPAEPVAAGVPVPLARALAEDNQTLAETLAAGGYDTLAVFTNPHHDEGSGFAQGFRLSRYLLPSAAEDVYARVADVEGAFRDLLARRDPARPLFAYVHYMDVHNPYRPPPRLAARFVRTRGTDRYVNGRPEGDGVPSADDLRFMIESYDACIRHVDESVRELAMIVAGVAGGRDTVFVVTADHGDEFMDHGGLGHGHSMHQELLRVPLVASGGALPAGVRVPGLARGIDVAATIASLADVPAPDAFEGRNLRPLIEAAARGAARAARPADPARVRVRLQGDEHDFSFAWNAHLRSLTTEDLHFMADNHLAEWALYDVHDDPHGQEDLFRKLGRPSRRLRRKIEEYERRLTEAELRTAALATGGSVAPGVDARSAEQLRALGYVE